MILYTPERQNLSKLGLTLEPGDTAPRIPPEVDVAVEIPQPFPNETGAFGSNPTLRTSGLVSQSTNVGASAAAQLVNVCTLSSGLWRVAFHFTMDSDFNTPSPVVAAGRAWIGLQSPGGVQVAMAARWPNTLVNEAIDFLLSFLLVDDGWIIVYNLPATGVGQTLSAEAQIQAVRLL